MTSYIIRRLFLMVVTLFGITIIQFAMINMMPGRPSLQSQSNSQDGATQNADQVTTESDRKWRESYSLDKPIILNTRPWLEYEDVLNIVKERLDGELVKKKHAAWQLDDLRFTAVPHLVKMANDTALDQKYRLLAIQRLPLNIQRTKVLLSPDEPADSELYKETMALNQEISWEDVILKRHSLKKVRKPSLEQINEEALWWQSWYEDHKERYEYTGFFHKVSTLFFDTRYALYYKNIFKGDLGKTRNNTLVTDEIADRLPVTMTLNLVSFLIIYMTALPIGILGAVRRAGLFDVSSTFIMFMLYSLPTFYIGLICLSNTAPGGLLDFLPSGGWEGENYANLTTWDKFKDRAWHSILPLFCMVYGSFASLSRFARTGLLEIIESDYIRTARAKGLSEWVVVLKHAARNGALPVLTLLGAMLPGLFGGSIIIEVIFDIQGMGLLFFESIKVNQDYAVLSGIMLITAVLVLVSLFIVDLLYTIVDPRISYDR